MKIEFFWEANFEISIIHKPSLGTHKIWARSVQSFWRLLDANRKTNCKQRILKESDLNCLFKDKYIYMQT